MNDYSSISAEKKTDAEPRQSGFAMHMHDDYEIYCFLDGDAEYIVEGRAYPLLKGDMILMRCSESHHILFRSAAKYKRITVNFLPARGDDFEERLMSPFNDRPLGKFNRYPAFLFDDMRHLHYLEAMCASGSIDEASAYLTVLLLEISEKADRARTEDSTTSDNFADLLDYINRHIFEPISLGSIAERFYISRSQLERRFRRMIGSSVWSYISEKRLLAAKKAIESGGSPTKIYSSFGYSDYTTFYRAYLGKFGFPPSRT